MGVDYYNCATCNEIFNDCGIFYTCSNCGSMHCQYCGEEALIDKYGQVEVGTKAADYYGDDALRGCPACSKRVLLNKTYDQDSLADIERDVSEALSEGSPKATKVSVIIEEG